MKKARTLLLFLVVGVLVFLWMLLAMKTYLTNVRLDEGVDTFGTDNFLLQEKTVENLASPKHCTDVDVVFTWVNGTDPQHIALLGRYVKNPQSLGILFRDYGMLRFGVRSIEKFVPWVRNIYIYTNGQVPTWLNVSAERVILVTHDQVFQDKTDLPTFNSNAIEANLRFLPGLSDCILYMNDDVFFGAPTPKSLFVDTATGELRLSFTKEKFPENEEDLRRGGWYRSINFTNNLINAYYHPGTNDIVKHHYAGHYCHFFRKDILDMIGNRWAKDFEQTSKNKFREPEDIALPFMHNNVALEEGLGKGAWPKHDIGEWSLDHAKNVKTWARLTSTPSHCICIQDRMEDPEAPIDAEAEYLEKQMCTLFPSKSSAELSTDTNPCTKYD